MNFYKYVAWRQRAALPDPVTMLTRLGIDPEGPSEVEVMRLTKQMKADAQTPKKAAAGIA
jgi:hypothetical protein